ncbi:MAG: DUF3800 domain-containing protein [Candidatus Omnitrophica bacterium]|nr:DUF3800 domain-containing protein [Candidatus Omnitrophota bacterium]
MLTENKLYNVYCDESCHLENDSNNVMTLGALWCLDEVKKDMFDRVREIKVKHGLPSNFEIKWTKVSPAKIAFYKEIVNFFFDEANLHFRAVVIKEKDQLDHARFENQDHDTWYYKMFFCLLNVVFEPHSRYRIFLDKKDTRSGEKIIKLHDVLCNSKYDFSKEIIKDVRSVHSHEIELLQVADLLIGAVGYANRGLIGSSAKMELIALIRELSGYSLLSKTLLKEDKMNLFFWTPNRGDENAE